MKTSSAAVGSAASAARRFKSFPRAIVGHVPTIAITPVADGRTGAYEANADGTWRMVEGVRELIARRGS